MPARMTVQESHDIALVLQHKVEGFEEVERAFVHGKMLFSQLNKQFSVSKQAATHALHLT